MKSARKSTVIWMAVLVFAGAAMGLIVSSRYDIMNQGAASSKEPFKASPALMQLSDGLADVASDVTPSVVNISTTKTIKQDIPENPFSDDPFFRKFFGEPDQGEGGGGGRYREFKERSLGSGVIVSSDGYIVTNNHVVEQGTEIKVLLSDKREFKGKIIGADPRSDVAVIKIDAKDLVAIRWGDSDKIRPGQMVMAVGSPFGLNQSVSMGIISATGRANIGIVDYEDFIQTDAAINPGNSGGALVNMRGELVGINTAIFSKTGGYQGIGFAVPVKIVKQVMESLIKTGKVTRGWMGVSVQNLTPALARQFGVESGNGALVGEVVKDSPAEKAGIKRGDVIIELDGNKMEDSGHVRNMSAATTPGHKVKIEVVRDKEKKVLELVMGEQPKDAGKTGEGEGEAAPETESALTGVSIEELTPQIIERLGLEKDSTGVLVVAVTQGSAADESGLLRGDLIMSINKVPVRDMKGFRKEVSRLKKGDPVLLLINRHGNSLWMSVSPSE